MVTRRRMLQGGAILALGATAPGVFGKAVREGLLDGSHAAAATQNPLLVVVQMAGGNDGINTVIPHSEGRYRDLRKNLDLAEKALRLDGRVGLHPELEKLKGWWDKGHLAVVEGVGYPKHSQSHFEAMHAWQTADPSGVGRGGWLGRYLDELEEREHHPLHGLNAGTPLSLEMTTGTSNVPAVDDSESYGLSLSGGDEEAHDRERTMLQLYETFPSSAPYGALLQTTLKDAMETADRLETAVEDYESEVDYPGDEVGEGLRLIAAIAATEPKLRVGHVTLGGFDTHSGQQGEHDQLMQQLSNGIDAFLKDMEKHGRLQDVVVMTWSEFGRRPEENNTSGTDHGSSGPMFLVGGGIKGGLYGEPSPLNNLDDDGNLRVTTDFRRVYATVLERLMGADPKPILGGSWEGIPLL